MDDPYQYETAPDDWVKRELSRLQIKVLWNKATRFEYAQAELLTLELERRERLRNLHTPK